MVYSMLLVSILALISLIQIKFNVNAMSTPVTSFSAPNPWLTPNLSRRYSLGTNADVGSFLSGANSGTQPTIVAIPLYIRNNLSKYPSIYELLASSNLFQQNDSKTRKNSETQVIASEPIISGNKLVNNENIKQNDFTSTQRFRTQKSTKYNIREEQQKVLRQRDHKYDTVLKDSAEFSSPQKTQWSPHLTNTPNRYSQSNDKKYSRPLQRYPEEEDRKQSSPEVESVFNSFPNNRFSELHKNEQKKGDYNQDYGSVDVIKPNSETFNRYNTQTYSPFSSSSEGKIVFRNRGSDKSTYNSPQTQSYSSDISEENPNFKYPESGNRDENYLNKNENKYQNQDNSDYENKNNEFQYRSPPIHIRSYDRSFHYSTPINSYTSRPSSLRQTNENSFVTSKPSMSSSFSPIASDDESSQQMSSNNYNNNNFQRMAPIISDAYNSQVNPLNNEQDSQLNGYAVNQYSPETQSVSPNNNYVKTESKPQFTSISNPNYSTDYSTPEEDCYDDNHNDYKNTYSSQSIKSQNIRSEIDTKNNERDDSYETEDLDPSKLDLKIVHLPVSLLRRLIGSGDLGLPSYE